MFDNEKHTAKWLLSFRYRDAPDNHPVEVEAVSFEPEDGFLFYTTPDASGRGVTYHGVNLDRFDGYSARALSNIARENLNIAEARTNDA